MKKIKINIGYETGNDFEPYDYIDDYIFVDDNADNLEIEIEVSKFIKSWYNSYIKGYSWEEVDDFYEKNIKGDDNNA